MLQVGIRRPVCFKISIKVNDENIDSLLNSVGIIKPLVNNAASSTEIRRFISMFINVSILKARYTLYRPSWNMISLQIPYDRNIQTLLNLYTL